MQSYWRIVKPLFSAIDYGNDAEAFAASIASEPRPGVLLFSAHMCLAEVWNGGFLQFFWNNTGVLAPEAVEGFRAIGMHSTAALAEEAAFPLGSPYPRDRNDRWDSLLVASGYGKKHLKRIFEKSENLYLAFKEATNKLPFDELSRKFLGTAERENGGFQQAADSYAQNHHLIQ